jgi:cystathionine beta-lyase
MFDHAELESIAALALEREMIVLVDEVHADLAYPGNTHIPFASLGREIAERTITITSATKAYNIPGLRCGIIHFGSSSLREQFRATIPDHLLGRAHRFGIEATIVAWQQCAAWLDNVIQVLADNRSRLGQLLASELPDIRSYPPQATYLAWLDCRGLRLPISPAQFFLDQVLQRMAGAVSAARQV